MLQKRTLCKKGDIYTESFGNHDNIFFALYHLGPFPVFCLATPDHDWFTLTLLATGESHFKDG